MRVTLDLSTVWSERLAKPDGPQRGQVHPGLIWQDAVGARPSSRDRTWPLSFLGCSEAIGPCCSQSRLVREMGQTAQRRSEIWRVLAQHATHDENSATPLIPRACNKDNRTE